jgi:hypothetical protein
LPKSRFSGFYFLPTKYKMSSVLSQKAQVPANKLYINITGVQSSIVDTNLAPVSWVNSFTQLSTAGTSVFRDMGKTVYIPDPTTASSANGQSTILRKIQYVPQGANGVYGTGAAASGNAAPGGAQEYYTGYIRLGGQTYGGGDGTPTGVARIN